MPDVVIENPILNSPFIEPTRHFEFTEQGITNVVKERRRPSSYFVPIPASKRKGAAAKQLTFDTEWTRDRIEENVLVNQIRSRVGLWRQGKYQGVTPTTQQLLQYWNDPSRERKLFFCQIEALETAIYLTEVARKYGDSWIDNRLIEANDSSNPGLPRMALKMATGAGKTVVMAMLIAWQTLNKQANPQDNRFSDTFLAITPGITIRDRLRVLLPSDPQNYYQQRDIVPSWKMKSLGRAKVLITNYHAFQLREKVPASKMTKQILGGGEEGIFTESPDEMVRRVCRELGTKKNIIVLNDEAHHCYRRRPDTQVEAEARAEEKALAGEDKKEAKDRDEEARIWISGVEAVKAKIGVKAIFDLSATPFFLRGSGYSEGTLFPWVVSDFSLIDAIECGIVKVPRVPIDDDAMTGADDSPTYRGLWAKIREDLPRKGRKTDAISGEPSLPIELEGALHSLYRNYVKRYNVWAEREQGRPGGGPPPVFIVVCNNTNVSKLVYDYVSGWEDRIGDHSVVKEGKLPVFSNGDGHGKWLARPNTILVDSLQLESGNAMTPEFKAIAAREIEEFKRQYRDRFPGGNTDDLTDEDLLREVMNTVGKPGQLGEHVRCVVSVSMLTEGWDANTVTHVLGVRAFGSQLLCEQVVGRALRRMSYTPNEDGMFDPEYAEVYGVPFSFIPSTGAVGDPKPRPAPTRVRALESRAQAEITFPRLVGYRYEIPDGRLEATFTPDSELSLSTYDIPSKVEVAGITGIQEVHELYDAEGFRPSTLAFQLAQAALERYLRDDEDKLRPWLFPQVLRITRQWMAECVTLKDNASIQMLTIGGYQHDAVDRIYRAIVATDVGHPSVRPILRPYDTVGSTRFVDYDTTKPVWVTDGDKCHVTHVVADTGSWEQKLAKTVEEMSEVVRYVKNENLGFTIPYTVDGDERQYIPDFIAVIDDGRGQDDLLQLLIEVTGEKKRDKAAKVATARTLWVPAVSNHGGFGRWSFIEIAAPWNAANDIRAHVASLGSQAVAAD